MEIARRKYRKLNHKVTQQETTSSILEEKRNSNLPINILCEEFSTNLWAKVEQIYV
eukprot:m.34053 g.34053  ORF g.34053 m.34053 type:complete len:56 (+) comp8659_c0_seq1:437-604(+)